MKTDKFTLFVYCNFLVLSSTTVCSQNINKQNVNIADETFTDYSFLSRYHYTKSKDDIEFVTEFPCLLGHPVDRCLIGFSLCRLSFFFYRHFNKQTKILLGFKKWMLFVLILNCNMKPCHVHICSFLYLL